MRNRLVTTTLRFTPDGFVRARTPAWVGTQPDSFLAVPHGNDIDDPVHPLVRAAGNPTDAKPGRRIGSATINRS
jgi:hypothetical protein